MVSLTHRYGDIYSFANRCRPLLTKHKIVKVTVKLEACIVAMVTGITMATAAVNENNCCYILPILNIIFGQKSTYYLSD